MLMMKGTGLVLSFLQISKAMGATIRTVATLSTKGRDDAGEQGQRHGRHLDVGDLSMMRSARRAGILLSMNS